MRRVVRNGAAAFAGAGLLIGVEGRGWADPHGDAERLFQEGRAAFDAKDYAKACAKLAESQQLDPNPSTLFNLAYCEEKRGQLVSARQHYREGYVQLPPNDRRLPIAKKWLADLDARLPLLTLRLEAGAPADASIHIAGVEVPTSALGTAQPIDPGEHVIVVTAPRRSERRFRVELAEGQKLEMTLNAGTVEEAEPAANPNPIPSAPREADRSPVGRTVGIVLVGVGGAAVILGAIGGGVAIANKNTMRSHCDADLACDQTGYDAAQAGSTWSTISTAAFATGGAALAIGAAVLLLTPNRSRATVAVSPRGLALRAGF